jgi:hypothetical protein
MNKGIIFQNMTRDKLENKDYIQSMNHIQVKEGKITRLGRKEDIQ